MGRRCIYCLSEKDETEFNDEHVLNRAFGTFAHNLVLKDVCTACNQFFGDTIDRKLARDTIEGLVRFHVGTKKVSDFKRYGRGSTTRVEFIEGPLQGATGHLVRSPDGTAIGVAPGPQIGFARSPDDQFEWFPLDALPTKQEILAKGYKPGVLRMQTQGEADTDAIRAALAKKGFTGFEITSDAPPLTGGVHTEVVFKITHPEFRAITKIALNYLAAVTSPEVALMAAFDAARRYVRYDERPPKRIVDANMNPWRFDGPDGKPIVGHYLCVQAVGEEIIAEVCLFALIRYTVRLAPGDVLLPASFGHLFDRSSNHVVAMPFALPIRNVEQQSASDGEVTDGETG